MRGFSLIELLIALGLTLALTASVVAALRGAPNAFAVQTEKADMRQRLRVALDSLARDIGAGALPSVFAPILPYRTGDDPPGTYRTDTITVMSQAPGGPLETTSYWLKADVATAAFQLMSRDGPGAPDVPVVDNVVSLAFEYAGDPQPPLIVRPLAEPNGPWTTYGPVPSLVAVGSFSAGENCVFVNDGAPLPSPRLAVLGAPGVTLIPLDREQLVDGPWCPDAVSPDRWDADLLRVRGVHMTIRVQAAPTALRGPAGALFRYGGTSRDGTRWVPDLEARVHIAPRNLNLAR